MSIMDSADDGGGGAPAPAQKGEGWLENSILDKITGLLSVRQEKKPRNKRGFFNSVLENTNHLFYSDVTISINNYVIPLLILFNLDVVFNLAVVPF